MHLTKDSTNVEFGLMLSVLEQDLHQAQQCLSLIFLSHQKEQQTLIISQWRN